MDGFITHCGAHEVTREEVLAVPQPVHTRTHKPVDYSTLLDFVELRIKRMGLETLSSAFAMNKSGQHLFAKWVIDTQVSDQRGLSIVARQSLNKQFKLAVAMGTNTFVCDNLAISGSFFRVMSKNTMNGWDRFRGEVLLMAEDTEPLKAFHATNDELNGWADAPLGEVDGYRLLGELYGSEEIMTPNQFSIAIGDWKRPRYEEFADRNLLNLYQCVTEGLKKGPAATMGERHVKAHQAFQQRALQG